jgi:hypothetical protein
MNLSVLIYALSSFFLPLFAGLARFEFSKMENESYPSWMADDMDRRTLVQGGVVLDPGAFSENANGYKYVESGTVIGRTQSEADNGTGFSPAEDTDDYYFITAHDVQYADENPEVAVVRDGALIRFDQLPGYGSFSSAIETALKDKYQIVPGSE